MLKNKFLLIFVVLFYFVSCDNSEYRFTLNVDNTEWHMSSGEVFEAVATVSGAPAEIVWLVDNIKQQTKGQKFKFSSETTESRLYIITAIARNAKFSQSISINVFVSPSEPGIIFTNPSPIKIRKGSTIELYTRLVAINNETSFGYSWFFGGKPVAGNRKSITIDTSAYPSVSSPAEVKVVCTNGSVFYEKIIIIEMIDSVIPVVTLKDKNDAAITANSTIEINYSSIMTDGYLLKAAVSDTSGDFRYNWYYDGILQDEKTDKYVFPNYIKTGKHSVAVSVDDLYGESNKTTIYLNITDDVGNRTKPTVTIGADITILKADLPKVETITAQYTDNSGDTLSFKWFVNNVEQTTVTTETFTYNVPTTCPATYEIKCFVRNSVFESEPAIKHIFVVEEVVPANDNVIFLNKGSSTGSTFTYDLDLGTDTKNIYFVFSNYGNQNQSGLTVTPKSILPSIQNNEVLDEEYATNNDLSNYSEINERIAKFNSSLHTVDKNKSDILRNVELVRYIEGNSRNFNVDGDQEPSQTTVTATLKKAVTVDTALGEKTLQVWVDNNKFSTATSSVDKLIQSDINELANKFLVNDLNNDIYDWVTSICGEEWGPTEYTNCIPTTDRIVILIYDIGNDNESSGTVGYFYSRDNYTKISYSNSNQEVMFYIDSKFLKDRKETVYSTLSHEFQHMIHFYQKVIKRNKYSATWFNEMCSMAVEDLVSFYLNIPGPRGINGNQASSNVINTSSRIRYFLQNPSYNIKDWKTNTDVYYSYGTSYVLGAFLIRNFGGAALINKLVQNDFNDFESIIEAIKVVNSINLDEKYLFQSWGASVLLSSDKQTGHVQFNNGNAFFESTIGSYTYKLGSINFYDYKPNNGTPLSKGVVTKSTLSNALIEGFSNVYFEAGNKTGQNSWTITLPANVEMTIVKK